MPAADEQTMSREDRAALNEAILREFCAERGIDSDDNRVILAEIVGELEELWEAIEDSNWRPDPFRDWREVPGERVYQDGERYGFRD